NSALIVTRLPDHAPRSNPYTLACSTSPGPHSPTDTILDKPISTILGAPTPKDGTPPPDCRSISPAGPGWDTSAARCKPPPAILRSPWLHGSSSVTLTTCPVLPQEHPRLRFSSCVCWTLTLASPSLTGS